MNKQLPDLAWFVHLDSAEDFLAELGWLQALRVSTETFVTVGCWSPEPIALMWILDASEVTVIELVPRRLDPAREAVERLLRSEPQSMAGRHIEFRPGEDILSMDLPQGRFDLAFCRRLLTNMDSDLDVMAAVHRLTALTQPGGWLVAVESMPGQHTRPRPREFLGRIFLEAGLVEDVIRNAPADAYCYRKPS